jgi:hypothetical protein
LVWPTVNNASEEHAAVIVTVFYTEDGIKTNSKTLVCSYQITLHHIPEENDLQV